MSTAALLRRVNKLEDAATGGIKAILWAEPGQDAAQVEADHVVDNPKDAGRVLVLSWQEVAA